MLCWSLIFFFFLASLGSACRRTWAGEVLRPEHPSWPASCKHPSLPAPSCRPGPCSEGTNSGLSGPNQEAGPLRSRLNPVSFWVSHLQQLLAFVFSEEPTANRLESGRVESRGLSPCAQHHGIRDACPAGQGVGQESRLRKQRPRLGKCFLRQEGDLPTSMRMELENSTSTRVRKGKGRDGSKKGSAKCLQAAPSIESSCLCDLHKDHGPGVRHMQAPLWPSHRMPWEPDPGPRVQHVFAFPSVKWEGGWGRTRCGTAFSGGAFESRLISSRHDSLGGM